MAATLACLICMFALIASVGFCTTFYVSNDGSDEADGVSADSAWETISRVNEGPIEPGDAVLFRRGDVWRGFMIPHSGNEEAWVTYGAYGEGPKPLLLGSITRNRPEDWVDEGGNVWSTIGYTTEVGTLIDPQTDMAWGVYSENTGEARGATDETDLQTLPASYRVTCAKPGERLSDIQLSVSGIAVEAGALYLLRLKAKCTEPFRMSMPVLHKTGPPWTGYASGSPSSVNVTSEWQEFEQLYACNVTADDGRLTIYLGGKIPAGAVLHIDSVSLSEAEGEGWIPCDVGNIIFDNDKSCGVKRWRRESLTAQDDYWYDENRHALKLYSEGNPAQRHSSIELALREHIINQGGKHHVIYENLACKYGGAHGIGGGGTAHIIIRDCDFGYIGGGDQAGGDRTVRFGNGIEFWGNAEDCLVERCRLWEIYDAALTNQGSGSGTVQRNITYRNNVIWNSEYSFEYWNRPEDSLTEEIYFDHNTCINAGHGWAHAQRPDPSGRQLCFYASPAQLKGMHLRNNIFFEAVTNAFYAPGWTPEQIDALVMDNNLWYQANGVMISIKGAEFPMADFARYQQERNKEPNSIIAIPGFVDSDGLDFHLAPGSPCVDAGADVGIADDIEGNARPNGAAPDIGAYER